MSKSRVVIGCAILLMLQLCLELQAQIGDKRDHLVLGTITGRVIDRQSRQPLPYCNITLVGTGRGASSASDGRFTIDEVPAATYTVQFSYLGYATRYLENVTVDGDDTQELVVELAPETILLRQVVVTPGQFSIGEGPAVQQTLTHEDLQTLPFGEDIYRATTRLPGVSGGDFTAKFTVRGGENEQILVLLDGMELYEPFHLKDIQGGALSIIDVAAVDGIELMTGGFPVEYGDRLSGVFNIKSTRPAPGRKQTSLGLSFMNTRAMSQGTFNHDKGAWLFSARRGYLDLVLDLMGEEDPPRPVYYDVFGKVDYQLHSKNRLSVHFLHAGDRLDYIEDDDDEDRTSYGNSYAWLTLKSFPWPKVFAQTVASYGRLTHNRDGIGYTGDQKAFDFTVADEQKVDLYGLKQDWNFDLSDRWFLKWGLDLRNFTAEYDYFSAARKQTWVTPDSSVAWTDTTRLNLTPSGTKFGLYLSSRVQLLPPLTAELGLRYDRNSFAGDDLLSPRLNLVYSLGKQTFLRAAWGYFYQSQGIHDIKVSEGEGAFQRAELAKHWVAGIEHTFRNGYNLRLEAYHKDLTHLRPAYRNVSNSLEVFPETQSDRFKLNLRGARSSGVELYFKFDRGGKWTWWTSYALAFAKDDIASLVYQGTEYTEFHGLYPGRYDQRHTFYLDLNYRPNRKWHLNASWHFHSGWPRTRTIAMSRQLPDGSIQYYTTYGDFNDANYPAYHRLDLRVNRYFDTSRGRIALYLALINIYNHSNVRSIDYEWSWNSQTGTPYLTELRDNWFKLLPSLGVSWNLNQ